MASGIDTLPLAMQSAIFLGTMSGVTAGGLVLAGPVLDGAEKLLGKSTFNAWSKTFSLLSFIFLAAGVAHFTSAEAFNSIYPPPGTWGLWALPGSSEFHVAWTGVAEVLGGTGLLVGSLSELAPEGVRDNLRKLRKISAAALFLLVVCVSPANIYMWTHNIPLKGLGPPGDIPVNAHYARGALQVVILGLLGRLASQEEPGALKEEEA
eukprot:CAMPEP_0177711936 /NCGR_PEP_ID=MMETSP0484_2-20121128/12130_1 /TAXON_ID=354590 /ORGANISM="Rhodomonas lens, Strain RHODO" /LENGTH=207 /DNA_ID=CAMNT_0019223709 /DNA_START=200 /DNA_END=823 /DNA_ORIENTATION=-